MSTAPREIPGDHEEPRPSWDADTVKQACIAQLPRVLAALGVKTTEHVSPSGFLECHAIDREDVSPSAGVSLESGCYVDRGGQEASYSILQLGVAKGIYKDFPEAVNALGEMLGVPPTTGTIPIRAKDPRPKVFPRPAEIPPPKRKSRGYATFSAAVQGSLENVEKLDGCEVVAEYRYGPDDIIVRFEKYEDGRRVRKEIRPFHRGEDRRWRSEKSPVRYLPFGIDDIPQNGIIAYVEGEKCRNIAAELGLPALSDAFGLPKNTDHSPLAGRDIAVLRDPNEAGLRYAESLKAELERLDPPARVRIVLLPGLEGKDDIEQFVERNPDDAREQIGTLIARAFNGDDPKTTSGRNPSPGSPEFTGDIRPLRGELLEVHPLPEGLLPLPLKGWLVDIAERGCFPLEYPVAAAFTALSVLIGRNLAIRPETRDAWTVVPNLWGAIVGPPGLQKTPAVEEAFLPLKRLVAKALEDHAIAEKRALEDAAISEARANAAKLKLKEGAKKGMSDGDMRKLAAEANGAGSSPHPSLKRYMINDATVEKTGELLRENTRGLLQFRDELGGFFRAMEKQGHETDRGFYLEAWTGNGSYTFDRIGRGTVHINALCLSVFGTIQPGPLAKHLKGAASGQDADGFMNRFQILVYPNTPKRFINVDRWPDKYAKEDAFEVFRWIDAMNPGDLGAELDEDRDLRFLRFDEAAQNLFDGWREPLENRLRDGSQSPLMTCHLAKYRSLMPSLALILHVINSVGCDRFGPVSEEATASAIAWCDFLESHARRIYQFAADGDPDIAARLGDRLKLSLTNPFTFRQVANKGWAGLDSIDEVKKAVGVLEDRNWARVMTRPPGPNGGRPSEEVWINPALLQESGEGEVS